MKALVEKLWTEPAYFVAAIVAVCEVVLQLVKLPDTVEIPLSVIVALGGGHVVRGRVRPLPKPRK